MPSEFVRLAVIYISTFAGFGGVFCKKSVASGPVTVMMDQLFNSVIDGARVSDIVFKFLNFYKYAFIIDG